MTLKRTKMEISFMLDPKKSTVVNQICQSVNGDVTSHFFKMTSPVTCSNPPPFPLILDFLKLEAKCSLDIFKAFLQPVLCSLNQTLDCFLLILQRSKRGNMCRDFNQNFNRCLLRLYIELIVTCHVGIFKCQNLNLSF